MIKETTDIFLINSFLNKFDTCIDNIGVYSKYIIYYIDEEEVGFLNYDLIYDRIEIDYIFVNERNRRNNIASFLLDYLLEQCKKNKCNSITLEVKKSNIGAIKFYKSKEFKEVAIREKYYENEDGILMIKEML